MVGEVISYYSTLEKLGKSDMGVVSQAEDTIPGLPVALRFLPDHLAISPQDKTRFIQEAKSASSHNHHNVATIDEVGEADGKLTVAIEFINRSWLLEGSPLAPHDRSGMKVVVDRILPGTVRFAGRFSSGV